MAAENNTSEYLQEILDGITRQSGYQKKYFTLRRKCEQIHQEILDGITRQSGYQKKYFTLRRKCEQIHQANEKLVNRLYYAKLLLKLYKKERRYLMGKLDDIGDNFRDVQVPVMWEEGPSIEELLGQPLLDLPTGAGIFDNPLGQSFNPPQDRGATAGGLSPKKTKLEKYEKELNLLSLPLPRKPVHVFVMFSDQHKERIRDEYRCEHGTDIGQHDLSRILAENWHSLSHEEKAVYQEMYEKEKLRYERRVREYELLKQEETPCLPSTSSIKKEVDS